MSTRLAIVCTIAIVFAAKLGTAWAHATLRDASPEAGSTVSVSPREVMLTFTDRLEPAFSSADVTDSNGSRVDEGKPQVSGHTIRIGLKTLPPGNYRVHWRAISVDTHRAEGNFTFKVSGQ